MPNELSKGVKRIFNGSQEVEIVQDNHTPAFRQYRHILIWTKYMPKTADDRFYHSCAFTAKELTQEDMANLYFMTRFMRDEELADINETRARGCGCGKCALPALPRVAYAGGGLYKIVASQRERVFTEVNISHSHITHDEIEPQPQQRRRDPEPIRQVVKNAMPEEINDAWEELGGKK